MAQIQLSNGLPVSFDDADLPLIGQHKWYPSSVKRTKHKEYVYAVAYIDKKMVRMHRYIMGLGRGDELFVDHIDGDTLNNRRSNLRICTRSQNNWNSDRPSRATSVYRGVSKYRENWVAGVMEKGKKNHLGVFPNPVLAAVIYNNYIRDARGEFGRTNLIHCEDEINELLRQKVEIDLKIEWLCAKELEQA